MNESAVTPPEAPLFLLQSLTLLLEACMSGQGTHEMTILPLSGREQFDFRSQNPLSLQAVRIRSSKSMFLHPLVQSLAGELDSDPAVAEARLILIGMVHPRLDKIQQQGKVALTKRSYDPERLLEEAAAGVAAFRVATGLPPQSGTVDQAVASCLATQLGDYSCEERHLSREALVALLREGILVATSRLGSTEGGHATVE